jgi:tetratricopeptide (TPR) repeat protein
MEEAILTCVLERRQPLPLDTRAALLLSREAPVVLQYLLEGSGGDAGEARLLEAAIEQDRLHELGLAAYLRVEPHLALAAWKQCTVQLYANPLVEAVLGQAELRGGDPQLAAQHLARALEGFGPIGFLATDMAEAAYLMGDNRSAKRLLEATLSMPIPSPYHREMLLAARLCVLEGDFDGALGHFERLVRLHRYLDVFRPYAELLERLGRRDHAVCVRYRALDRYRFPNDQRAFLRALWKWVVLDRAWDLKLPPGSKARWAVRPRQFLHELWLALGQVTVSEVATGG